ncbi:30S ribosomal protein S21 [Weeksellaceae bacterium KMM 9713]|uniref:Small ribosomal subunit protein bS21 n=1 Tax=Profundicola chukchiensis TaxID=2961959 RepID=A0A9X4RV76_9FLAO|nr:30S ribosomal protein S21 [Profundicola chukchiensis]MDG4946903.1 30S ribosomal protein S21 [Profundicola chukchiensis]MDG4951395.1 30S ribosomal protein S21 [Profundicola chukchiensis]
MLIIPVKDGEAIDRALKRYKRKYDRTRVVRQLRARQQYTKPSVVKRQQLAKARYKQQMQSKEDA